MKHVAFACMLVAAVAWMAGCTQQPAAPPQTTQNPDDHGHEHGHEHGEHGPHDGHLVELGGGKYHAEVVHDDASGLVTVYLLGEDAKSAVAIEEESLVINAMVDGQAQRFVLPAKPLEEESDGKSSRYELADPALVKALDTPESKPSFNVTIGGTPYIGSIKPHDHGEHGHSH